MKLNANTHIRALGNDIFNTLPIKNECYTICVENEELVVYSNSSLGFVYGIYKISSEFLRVTPF